MVFQMTKLNLIIFISLCVVTIEAGHSNEMPSVKPDKQVKELGGAKFTYNDDYEVIVGGTECTWRVDMKKATADEVANGGGYRNGSLWCKGWNVYRQNSPIPNIIITKKSE
ncbi:unnamed protein product [Trichobilharzia szidati]|nr:unnamed protein product [Trichobilharzia szidati]